MKRLFQYLLSVALTCFVAVPSCSGLDVNPEQEGEIEEQNSPSGEKTEGKILVAYFSFTGHSKSIAETIAKAKNADIYQIIPEEPYSSDNSNYYDESTRAYKEQYGDAGLRPGIKKTLENDDDYDIIILGSPIWYGKSPRVILSFLDAYGFKGKTIVPFVSSAATGIDRAESELKSTYKDIIWKSGKRFSASPVESDILAWLKEIDI